MASWAETEIPLGQPTCCPATRSHARTWWGCWAGRWPCRCRRRSAMAHGRRGGGSRLRADAGISPGNWPAPPRREHGVRDRRQADHQHVEGTGRDRRGRLAGRDRDMQNAQVAVSPYKPADCARRHRAAGPLGRAGPRSGLRRPRSRRRRTLHPDQRALPFPSWSKNPLSRCSSSAPTWTCPPRPRRPRWSTGTGTAPASRTSPRQQARRRAAAPAVGLHRDHTCSMWASLIAAAIAAWLHQLTGLLSGGEWSRPRGPRRQGHRSPPCAGS